MVRADRNYPNVYFGRPGSLVTLPWPRGEMDKGYERQVYDFVNATGGHIVSTMLGGSRSPALTWNALHVDNYAKLEQYWTGMMGQGPWAYIDPSATNMLLPNQASATNMYYDTRDFTATAGTALSSSFTAAGIHRPGATRSLRALWASAPGATFPAINLMPPYRSWYGYPVMPGLPYRFAVWVKPDGVVETSITVAIKMQYFNAAGASLGIYSGGDTVVTGWQQLTFWTNAPAGAAYVQPFFQFVGSTISAGGSFYMDELLFEQDSILNDWAPGTGTRPVEIVGFNDLVAFNTRFRRGLVMTLRELVP